MHELLGDIDGFLAKLVDALYDDGINVTSYELDHICYRVETSEQYEHHKQELGKLGEQLSENVINGRPIAVYKLHEPIRFRGRKIYCVEVPAPKDGYPYPKGLEHAEFVIDCSFEEFMNRHKKVKFDTRFMNNPNNPDIIINYDGFCVKFHQQSLEKVIEIEKLS